MALFNRSQRPLTGKLEAEVVRLSRVESGPLRRRNQRLLLPSPAPPSDEVEGDIPARLIEYGFLQHALQIDASESTSILLQFGKIALTRLSYSLSGRFEFAGPAYRSDSNFVRSF